MKSIIILTVVCGYYIKNKYILESPCGVNPAFNVVYVCMWCF